VWDIQDSTIIHGCVPSNDFLVHLNINSRVNSKILISVTVETKNSLTRLKILILKHLLRTREFLLNSSFVTNLKAVSLTVAGDEWSDKRTITLPESSLKPSI
jgi:hypothetical protein